MSLTFVGTDKINAGHRLEPGFRYGLVLKKGRNSGLEAPVSWQSFGAKGDFKHDIARTH
jgi:hypothetical protein